MVGKRESYNIVKVKVSAGASYKTRFATSYIHELNIWFDDTDLNKMGHIEKVSVSHLFSKGIIKRGLSFKKSQDYYNSEEGKNWLSKYLEATYTGDVIHWKKLNEL